MTPREWHCQNPNCAEHGVQTTAGILRKWCSEHCRRRTLYGGTCLQCGATTNGHDGPGTAADYCKACAPAVNKVWNRDAIVFVIQEWADDHGGVPPTATDFRRERAVNGPVPAVNTVQGYFGTWNAAIVAAGFEPHACGPVGGYTVLTPGQRTACATRYANGESSVRIAADLGCSPKAVIEWARKAGVPIREPFHRQRVAA